MSCNFVTCIQYYLVQCRLLENFDWSKLNSSYNKKLLWSLSLHKLLCQIPCFVVAIRIYGLSSVQRIIFRQIAESKQLHSFFHLDKDIPKENVMNRRLLHEFFISWEKRICKSFHKLVRKIKPICNMILWKIMPRGTTVPENTKSKCG